MVKKSFFFCLIVTDPFPWLSAPVRQFGISSVDSSIFIQAVFVKKDFAYEKLPVSGRDTGPGRTAEPRCRNAGFVPYNAGLCFGLFSSRVNWYNDPDIRRFAGRNKPRRSGRQAP